jgi:hypothetical protein
VEERRRKKAASTVKEIDWILTLLFWCWAALAENLRSKDLKLRESAMRVLDEMIKEMEGYEKVMINY